jgi:hypothetical protein
MITGDHVLTASSIGAQIGIGDGTTAMTGGELDTLSDDKLLQVVEPVEAQFANYLAGRFKLFLDSEKFSQTINHAACYDKNG